MKRYILLVIVIQTLLSVSIKAYCQSNILAQEVTLYFEEISLEKLLDFVNSTYQINLSYSADNIPLNKTISITAFNLPLRSFIEQICSKAELTYQVYDNHIVLREKIPAKMDPLKPSDGISEKIITINNKVPSIHFVHNTIENIEPIKRLDNPDLPFRRIDEVAAIIQPVERQAFHKLYRKEIDVAIGLLGSYDHYQFDFKERANTDQLYGRENNFSLGISGTFWPRKQISASISLLVSSKNYRLDYNYEISNSDDPFPFPAKTNVCLSYLQLPVEFNYKIFNRGNMFFNVSAGFTSEILVLEEENTRFLNGEAKPTDYLVEDNNNILWGGTLGVKLWYNLNHFVSIFFKPDYIYYFTPLNDRIMDSNTQLLKLRAGISLNIKENK